jgi:adenine-specific DNA-methyltransferase
MLRTFAIDRTIVISEGNRHITLIAIANSHFANNAIFFISTNDKHLLGILNSKLGWFLIKNKCTRIQGAYQLIWEYFSKILITKNKSTDLESLVEKTLSLNKLIRESTFRRTDKRTEIQEEIGRTDSQIDKIVYSLYGIDENEQKIIEQDCKISEREVAPVSVII